MTDIKNHSEEIWRTLVLYQPVSWSLRKSLVWYLEFESISYSFCYYGERDEEPEHISFRIAFPSSDVLIEFRKWFGDLAKEYELKFDEIGYDEAQMVKIAYVIGTKIYNEIMKVHKLFGVNNNEFLMLMLHGMFNDLAYLYHDELQFYNYASKRVMSQMW